MSDQPVRLLVIDDDDADRKTLRRTLLRTGLDCVLTEASSVAAALGGDENADFDFIVLDFNLPDSDGLVALEQVKLRWPTAAVSVVTGQGDETIAAESIKSGAIDYIPKRKINENSLRRVVEKGLEISRLQKQLDEKRYELETFAYALAHDLKAPLTAIGFFADSVVEFLEEGAYHEASEDAVSIGRYVKRMRALIDCLSQHLGIAETIRRDELDTEALIRDALSNLLLQINETEAQVDVADLPPVLGDGVQITRLLQNLISNSLKFRSAAVPHIRISCIKHEGPVRVFAVRDNGIGIAHDMLDRVFVPFKRLHTADDYPGTGLGLATCQKIVAQHGGKIWCESKPGVGTTFFFTLPGLIKAQVAA